MDSKITLLAQDIEKYEAEIFEIEADMAEAYHDIFEEIEMCRDAIAEQQDRIGMLMMDLEERAAQETADIRVLKASVKEAEDKIRDIAKNLDAELLTETQKFNLGGAVSVTISRVASLSEYDVPGLLEAFPQLREAHVDGDPVCVVTVVPELIDRLVDRKAIPADVYRFRRLVKSKSPTVTIKRAK